MGLKASSNVRNGTQPNLEYLAARLMVPARDHANSSPPQTRVFRFRTTLLSPFVPASRRNVRKPLPQSPPSPRDREITSHLQPLNDLMMHTSLHVFLTRKPAGQTLTHVNRRRPLRRIPIVRSSRAKVKPRVIYLFICASHSIHPSIIIISSITRTHAETRCRNESTESSTVGHNK